MVQSPTAQERTAYILLSAFILGTLFEIGRHNYLLFHTLVELFSVIVASGIFLIAWNSRRFMDNHYFLFLGIGCFFVGMVDLFHTLSYKNMGVFPSNDANLPTQLWIAGRYLQVATFLLAHLFLKRRLNPHLALIVFAVASSLLTLSIFAGIFPDCFVEGVGLTTFKIVSEYVISLGLLGAIILIRRDRQRFSPDLTRLLYTALTLLIIAELSFTLYSDVFGIINKFGHFLKVVGAFFIYKALIQIGLTRPYDLLFRELKESEEALVQERNELRDSEERYRHLYKDTPVMLNSIDRDGCIVNVSDFWLQHLGYTQSEVLCKRFTDFFTAQSRVYADQEILPEFFRSGSISDVPFEVVRKNGEVRDVLLSARAEKDDRGEVVKSFLVMVDVTERKHAEEQVAILNHDLAARAYELQSANTDLEAFNYTVSHDLRAPLANIGGCCSIIREMYSTGLEEEGKEFLSHIDSEVRRMDKLIGTLLNFARMGRQELHRTTVNLSNIATVICLGLKMRHPDRPAEFSIAENVTCNGDNALLRIALENLIGNAWKYSGKKETTRIEFGVVDIEGEKTYFVRDNGAGFKPDLAEKLFLPFQRLHGGEFEGFGIGLATVQKIVYRHGGRIHAEGEVGKGATFYFTLPAG